MFCEYLGTITFKGLVEEIAEDAFIESNNNLEIIIPLGTYKEYLAAFKGIESKRISEDPLTFSIECFKGPEIKDKYGGVYSADGKYLKRFRGDADKYAVKRGTEKICNWAFACRGNLKLLTLPSSVKEIGEKVFERCCIEKIYCLGNNLEFHDNALFSNNCKRLIAYFGKGEKYTIPNGVSYIGRNAFAWSSIHSINIPDSVTSIGRFAFAGCSSLHSIKIPESVISIGDGVFDYCTSLQSIYLPDSVTSIEAFTFDNCSCLKSINIPRGTKDKFAKLFDDGELISKLKEIDE